MTELVCLCGFGVVSAITLWWAHEVRNHGEGVAYDGSGQNGGASSLWDYLIAFITAAIIAYILFNNIGF